MYLAAMHCGAAAKIAAGTSQRTSRLIGGSPSCRGPCRSPGPHAIQWPTRACSLQACPNGCPAERRQRLAPHRAQSRRLSTAPSARHPRTPHGSPPLLQLRHPEPARRPATGPDDRRAGDADLPDDLLRLPRHRSRGGAVQHGARGPRVLAHLQPDERGAGGAHRRARRRHRRARHGERPGGAAPGARHDRRRRLAHRRQPLAVRRIAQSAALHAAALRHRDHVRGSARPGRVDARDPAEHEGALRRDARQSRAWTC